MAMRGLPLGVSTTSTTSALPVLRDPVAPMTSSMALVDLAVVAVVSGTTILMVRGGFAASRAGTIHFDAVGVAMAILVGLPLLAWRRQPFGVFAVSAAASVLMASIGYPIGLPLAPAVALYVVAAERTEAHPWTRMMTAATVVLLVAYVAAAGFSESTFPASELFHAGLLWSAAWFAGERTRLRREQIAELKREAQRERMLATAEERTRIARDLHDSVGHAINVIGVRAGAARLRHAADPTRSLDALEAIEDLARRTVADIDHFVGTLRASAPDDDSVRSPAGLASLPALIAQHSASGLDVECTLTDTAEPLPPVVDQAVFRIIQEALTNASRHGTGAARITMHVGERAIELTVTNPVGTPQTPTFRLGHGVIGMHERARLVGGSLDIDQVSGDYTVRARIPIGTAR